MQMKDSNFIRVVIAGDFCHRGRIEKLLHESLIKKKEILKKTKRIFEQSDLAIVNLENTLTENINRIQKNGSCLKAKPDMIHLHNFLGVNLVTLANNHVRDFGDQGVIDTLSLCKKHHIDTIGAGNNSQEARKIYYRCIKGRTLAVINVAENEFANASPNRAGANPLDLISLIADIRDAKSFAEHVLLIIHGGLEYVHYPSPQSVRVMRFLAEQGPTAIIRHHPHYVQGIEVWKGVPIFYSLGNFIFDTPDKTRSGWFEGILVALSINPADSCSYEVHPFEQCKNKPVIRLLEGTEKKSFLERLDRYSKVILDSEKHKQKWQAILNERRQVYLGMLTLPSHFLFRLFRKLKLIRYIKATKRKRLLWENYIRCEAHREVLLDILETDSK